MSAVGRAAGPRPAVALALLGALLLAAPAAAQQASFELQSTALWTNAAGFRIARDYAFCGMGDGLLVLDLRNLSRPEPVSFTLSPDSAVTGFAFGDPVAYLGMGSRGVAVIEAFNPEAPRVVATVPARRVPVFGYAGRDSLVFTTEGDSLFVYAVDGETDPRLRFAVRVPTRDARLAFAGARLLVFGESGLFTYGVGFGGALFATDTLVSGDEVPAAAGDSAHVFAALLEAREIVAFQEAEDGRLVESARGPLPGSAADMVVGEGFLAVATDSGFGGFALSEAGVPTLLFDRFDGDSATAVTIEGRTLGVARRAEGFEFYTILLPFEFANVQNVDLGAFVSNGVRSGNYVYVASPDSGVYRFPAPGAELRAGELLVAGAPQSVGVRDSVVIVGTGGQGIRVYTEEPGGPATFRSTLPFAGNPLEIAVQDTLVAVASAAGGLVLAGITDLSAAETLSVYRPSRIFNARRAAFVGDRLLYVFQPSTGVHILDVSDPEFPRVDSVLAIPTVADVAVDTAASLLLALHGQEGSRFVTLFDISDRRRPVPVDTIDTFDGDRVSLSGGVALVSRVNRGFFRFGIEGFVLNRETGGETLGRARWIAHDERGAYFLEGASGIQVFIGTAVADLAERSPFRVVGNVVSVATQDSTVVAGDHRGQIASLRVAAGGELVLADTLGLSGRVNVIGFLSADTLCAVSSGDAIYLVDIAPGGRMTALGSVDLESNTINAFVRFDRYLLAGAGTTVYVVDVSDPAAPALVGEGFSGIGGSGVTAPGAIRDLVIRGSSLFVEFRGGLITAFDLSTSIERPVYLGAYREVGTQFLGAVLDGAYLYVAAGSAGVRVLSVTDPSRILLSGVVTSVETPEAISVVGRYLVTSNGFAGFSALDLEASETEPPVIASVNTPGRVRNVAALPGLILVADAQALLMYGTEVVVADSLPPEFAVGLVENPFITAYADLYLVPSERIQAPPTVRLLVADLDSALTVTVNDPNRLVYTCRMFLNRVGEGQFLINGCDRRGNCGTRVANVTFDLLRGASGGTISIDDSAFAATIPPGAFAGEARPVALAVRPQDLAVGAPGAGPPEGGADQGYRLALPGAAGAPVVVSFRAPRDGAEASGWEVFRRAGDRWEPLLTRRVDGRLQAEGVGGGLFWLAPGEASDGGRIARPALEPNAPNPFNPRTRIRYTVPSPGARVRLSIVAPDGRLVRTLADGHEPAGPRERAWEGEDDNGRPAASGVYILRYEVERPGAARETLTRKMTLLR